ncbi:MAG: transporter substrate-binding domain-containing protein [Cyclobacteriaceae bacterium]
MKPTIKFLAIPIILGMAITNPLIAQVSGDTYQSAKSSKSANLTYVYAGVNGFANKGADGNLSGLFIELMSEFESFVSTKYGITINSTYVPVKDGDFQQFLNDVKNGSGGVFGLNTTTIKEERKEFLKFSPAILNNISVLITHKSVPTLSSMGSIGSDFKGLAAYTASGSTYEKRLTDLKSSNFPDLNIKVVASEYDIIDSIIGDPRSFGFIDISFYLEYLTQRKEVKRHPAGDLGGEQYGIIMPLDSDWDPIMAEFLNSGFLKSTTYRQIVINNLGKGALRMLESN